MNGCLYDSKNKLCRASPGDQIDYRCLKNERNRCIPNPNPVEPQAPAASAAAADLPEVKVSAQVLVEKDLQYLSGPVAFSSYYYQGRVFNFLGDMHNSKAGTCDKLYPSACSQKTTTDGKCFDLIDLLQRTFANAQKSGKYVDFFLELPFRSKVGGDSLEELHRLLMIAEVDKEYILSIQHFFSTCFMPTKRRCPYGSNVRFHYADIRQLMNTYTSLISINSYLFISRLQNCLNYFSEVVTARHYSRSIAVPVPKDNFIELTHLLITTLYSRGHTMSGKTVDIRKDIFMAYFDSDDFPATIQSIIDSLVAPYQKYIAEEKGNTSIQHITEILRGFYSVRGGKKIHKVRAQLLALEDDGMGEMAAKIRDFIMRQYDTVDPTALYIQWMRFYNVYQNLKTAVDSDKHLMEAMAFVDNIKNFTDETNKLLMSDALLMDTYVLARMFRVYNGKGSKVSDTVIVYAGDAHIKHYEKFFTEVLGAQSQFHQRNTPKDLSRGKQVRCITGRNLTGHFY